MQRYYFYTKPAHNFFFFADMAIIVNELNTVNIINFIRISKSKEWFGLKP